MHRLIHFIKNWTLPIALTLGIVGYKVFVHLSFLTPYLIFTMLFLTFSKVSIKDLRLKWWHLWLTIIELGGALAIYFIVNPFNHIVAESLLVCVICPTATAAAVITGKLGGNVASITTYTLLSNIVVAIAIPIIFPMIEVGAAAEISFASAFIHLMSKIFPLLILPFIVAEILRMISKKAISFCQRISGVSFYLWGIGLTIVTAQTVESFFDIETNPSLIAGMAIGSLIICMALFFSGKALGKPYDDMMSAGQAIGQKNTILAIWMCHTYLNPISALGPGAYVLWQNLFNSYQLWYKRKQDNKKTITE